MYLSALSRKQRSSVHNPSIDASSLVPISQSLQYRRSARVLPGRSADWYTPVSGDVSGTELGQRGHRRLRTVNTSAAAATVGGYLSQNTRAMWTPERTVRHPERIAGSQEVQAQYYPEMRGDQHPALSSGRS